MRSVAAAVTGCIDMCCWQALCLLLLIATSLSAASCPVKCIHFCPIPLCSPSTTCASASLACLTLGLTY